MLRVWLIVYFSCLNDWKSIWVIWGVLYLLLMQTRTCVLITNHCIEWRWTSHLEGGKSNILGDLINIFHREQLFVIRSSWLTFCRGSFVESCTEGVFAICALHRLYDLVFWVFILIWQEVGNAYAKLLLNYLVSQLELFFEVFNDLVALFDVELCAMLSTSDVKLSKMKLVLLLFLEGLEIVDICYFSCAFDLLLLKKDKFISLFCLIGELLPDCRLFLVVFFYLSFELKYFLLELWTVLAFIATFWE